jgi:hypothetical protein
MELQKLATTLQTRNDFRLCFQLFIAGHLFDQNCNLNLLVKDIVRVIFKMAGTSYYFSSPFDQKGVLTWIKNEWDSGN